MCSSDLILPNLYNYILEQSKNFSKEALNRHAATMRMRGRPKVVLARTYEEAHSAYLPTSRVTHLPRR